MWRRLATSLTLVSTIKYYQMIELGYVRLMIQRRQGCQDPRRHIQKWSGRWSGPVSQTSAVLTRSHPEADHGASFDCSLLIRSAID